MDRDPGDERFLGRRKREIDRPVFVEFAVKGEEFEAQPAAKISATGELIAVFLPYIVQRGASWIVEAVAFADGGEEEHAVAQSLVDEHLVGRVGGVENAFAGWPEPLPGHTVVTEGFFFAAAGAAWAVDGGDGSRGRRALMRLAALSVSLSI